MANNIWSNYTEKTATPVDADEVMVRDSTDGKNKRLLFGTFWKWVAKKLNEATISELETENKTIIGAINALYRHAIHKIYVEANTKYYIPIPHYFGAIIIGTIGGSRCIIGIFNVPNDPTFFYILGKDSTHPEISVVSDECNESKFTFITPINTAGFVWY